MKCIPSADGFEIVPETPLEAHAVERWRRSRMAPQPITYNWDALRFEAIGTFDTGDRVVADGREAPIEHKGGEAGYSDYVRPRREEPR